MLDPVALKLLELGQAEGTWPGLPPSSSSPSGSQKFNLTLSQRLARLCEDAHSTGRLSPYYQVDHTDATKHSSSSQAFPAFMIFQFPNNSIAQNGFNFAVLCKFPLFFPASPSAYSFLFLPTTPTDCIISSDAKAHSAFTCNHIMTTRKITVTVFIWSPSCWCSWKGI